MVRREKIIKALNELGKIIEKLLEAKIYNYTIESYEFLIENGIILNIEVNMDFLTNEQVKLLSELGFSVQKGFFKKTIEID